MTVTVDSGDVLSSDHDGIVQPGGSSSITTRETYPLAHAAATINKASNRMMARNLSPCHSYGENVNYSAVSGLGGDISIRYWPKSCAVHLKDQKTSSMQLHYLSQRSIYTMYI